MTTRRLITGIALLAVLAIASTRTVDTDTWWHLRVGEWILQNSTLPGVDYFSFTQLGAEWHYPGWLAESCMALLYRWGDIVALKTWVVVMILLSFLLIFRTCKGDPFLRAITLVMAAATGAVFWSARPQMFSFLFSAMFFLILWVYEHEHKNLLWMLPLIMVIWVNSHGGFAIGFLLLAFSVVGSVLQALTARPLGDIKNWHKSAWLMGIGVVCVGAILFNPYHYEMLEYPFRTVSISVLQHFIQEWQSPNFHSLSMHPFLWLMLFSFAAVGFSGTSIRLWDLVFLTGTIYLSFLAARNIPLAAIILPAVCVAYGTDALKKHAPWWQPTTSLDPPKRILNGLLLGIVFVGVMAKAALEFSQAIINAQMKTILPINSAQYLKEHPGLGNMFNAYNWGAYIIWAVPEYPVFVDGRTDLFDGEILRDYLMLAYAGEEWKRVLERWEIDVIFQESHSPLVQLLVTDGWKILYRDSQAAILCRPGNSTCEEYYGNRLNDNQ